MAKLTLSYIEAFLAAASTINFSPQSTQKWSSCSGLPRSKVNVPPTGHRHVTSNASDT